MKIALVQLNPIVGDLAGNQKKILRWIKKAKDAAADLVAFPELALTGYPPRDLLELPHFVQKTQEALLPIIAASNGIAVVVGSVIPNPNPTGKGLYNSAVWCENGKVRATIHKRLLPTYDVFDEDRYFEPGTESRTLEFKGMKVGVTICEDLWNYPEIFPQGRYPDNPIVDLLEQNVDLLVNLSASPYSCRKLNLRLELLRHSIQRCPATLAYVNQVGGNDELIFDGGSLVMNPDGELAALGPFFKEGMILHDIRRGESCVRPQLAKPIKDIDQFGDGRTQDSPLRIPNELQMLENALVCGLRDYTTKCGFKKVTLGLSGGVDSALVAYLAAKALGPKNVMGLMMPSRYSSKGSIDHSKALAKNLKIPTKIIPIDPMHKAYEKSFKKMFGDKKPDTTEENIQARIRGNLLMALSNKLGHMALSTVNKSESAVGYGTLYGDLTGGMAVISDVPKTMVYELCRFINRRKEIIPEAILTKAPSAELRPNQKDQDSLPPYDILDGILKAVVEDLKSEEEIVAMGYEKKTVQKVTGMIRKSEYKRRQVPPGLKVTSKAFGVGRRYPIASKF